MKMCYLNCVASSRLSPTVYDTNNYIMKQDISKLKEARYY